MPGNPHPAYALLAIAPSDDVDKAEFFATFKANVPWVVPDFATIAATSFDGQVFILVKANGRTYRINTEDTTTPLSDALRRDYDGIAYEVVAAGGSPTFRDETTSGDVTLTTDDDIVRLKPAAPQARQVTVPSGITKPLVVRDTSRVWSTYNTTFVGSGGATINGVPSWVGSVDGGGFEFTPDGDGDLEASGVG